MAKDGAARQAAREIVRDLQDRAGLGDEWDQIDETQAEIIDTWTQIVRSKIEATL